LVHFIHCRAQYPERVVTSSSGRFFTTTRRA
jgi:hypothetical protein